MNPCGNASVADLSDGDYISTVLKRETGWQACFEALYRQHHSYLYHRCLRRLGEPSDVEDVLQEVFLSAWRHLGKFEGRSSLKTWLVRIADNECTLFQRRQQRYLNVEHIEQLIELHETMTEFPEPGAVEDKHAKVGRLMGRLPPAASEVIALRYWGDLRLEQIGTVLGISLSATKMRVQRALQHARLVLEADITRAA